MRVDARRVDLPGVAVDGDCNIVARSCDYDLPPPAADLDFESHLAA